MNKFGDKLKAARLRKGLKQSDVAAVLDCASTSLTNWEKGNIQPSVDVLSRLCEVLEISPLDLLSKHYSFDEITAIAAKPAYEREYEQQIALNFSSEILKKLLPAEKQRQEVERIEQTAFFIRSANLLERFDGSMENADIEVLKSEYDTFGVSDNDILFAFHALTKEGKSTFLDVVRGLINIPENIESIVKNMDRAVSYTNDKLKKQCEIIRFSE